MEPTNQKIQLRIDLNHIVQEALDKRYDRLGYTDIFALGYVAGKYGLSKLIDNEEEVIKACEEYDKTDNLGLADTVKECLMDLDIIPGVIR